MFFSVLIPGKVTVKQFIAKPVLEFAFGKPLSYLDKIEAYVSRRIHWLGGGKDF